MGRNSGRKPSRNIRGQMRGLKNRWGRFQCPRDGSICKSLEAWHWHRHKHHPTENINFIELDGDDDDDNDEEHNHHWDDKDRKSPHSSPTNADHTQTGSNEHSSSRLLPPEAFAPLRSRVAFPDDISDLTEPEIPILLSEDVANVAEFGEMVVLDSLEVQRKDVMEQSSGSESRLHGAVGESGNLERCKDSRVLESTVRNNSNDSHGRSRASEHSIPGATGGSHTHPPSSIFKVIALFVMELLDKDSKLPTLEEVLPVAEAEFKGLGVSQEALVGVVTGALVGAKDRWKHGYDSGWRDGAKEVLHAPLLRGLALPLHSLDAVTSPEPTDKVLTPSECVETGWKNQRSEGQCRGDSFSVDKGQIKSNKLDNLGRNWTEPSKTPSERSRNYSTGSDHHSNHSNKMADTSS